MVMEVAPSPQCVGREFVRQYYTLLNKAPTHVHRFYNNNSSFVHGGLDVFNREGKPAVGQKQIHQCIQQLNFRDCHAKITQVDSQATLGNGVVVQVTGELSNGGQPMRRFTQTFVLGAQSPKQYYVHNDIFRYQDLVFSDDDGDQESHHYEPEDEEPEHPQPQEHPQVQQQEGTYYPSAPPMPTVNGAPHADHVTEPTPVQAPPPATPSYNDIISHHQHVQQQPPPVQAPPPQAVPVYGDVTAPEPSLEPEQPQPATPEPEDKPQEQFTPPPQPADQEPPLAQDSISSNEPKTYASTLVKSGGGVSNFNTSPSGPTKSPPSPPPPMTRLESRNNEANLSGGRGGGGLRPGRGGGPLGRGGLGRGMENRPPRPSLSEDTRDYGGREDMSSDGDRRRSVNSQSQYSDDHQLFLGNLPLNASENDLRDLFKTFGPIVDLRIMSKSNMKGQNGNKVPNYGFIIFERTETVQAVLQSRPIYFPGENGVKLNVEEKKTKPRIDGGGGGGRGGGIGRGGLSRGGQRGGFSRGGAGMRPGFTQRGGPR